MYEFLSWTKTFTCCQELCAELQEQVISLTRTLHRNARTVYMSIKKMHRTAKTFYMPNVTLNRILNIQNARAPWSFLGRKQAGCDKQVKQLQANIWSTTGVQLSHAGLAIRETFKHTDLPRSTSLLSHAHQKHMMHWYMNLTCAL